MGYTTEFSGRIEISPKVSDELRTYIKAFSRTRHQVLMVLPVDEKYDETPVSFYLGENKTPVRRVMGKKYCPRCGLYGYEYHMRNFGLAGEFYTEGTSVRAMTVVDNNTPPSSQPKSVWCHWIVDQEGYLVWDQGEKFNEYQAWLIYMINNFFIPNGHVLNGAIVWEGQEPSDYGTIVVTDNEIEMRYNS